jgi:hypothetical protein
MEALLKLTINFSFMPYVLCRLTIIAIKNYANFNARITRKILISVINQPKTALLYLFEMSQHNSGNQQLSTGAQFHTTKSRILYQLERPKKTFQTAYRNNPKLQCASNENTAVTT